MKLVELLDVEHGGEVFKIVDGLRGVINRLLVVVSGKLWHYTLRNLTVVHFWCLERNTAKFVFARRILDRVKCLINIGVHCLLHIRGSLFIFVLQGNFEVDVWLSKLNQGAWVVRHDFLFIIKI